MTAVKSITRVAPRFNNAPFADGKTVARWLCVSALAVGALGAANPARANGVFWSVGVASPGVQVAVSNAPPVVYPSVVYQQPQVIHQQPAVVYQQPQVVYQHPPVVYQQPQVVYHHPHPGFAQRVVVVPQPVLVPHGHGRPVLLPQPVVYQHGWYRGWGHHPGHGGGYGGGHHSGPDGHRR